MTRFRALLVIGLATFCTTAFVAAQAPQGGQEREVRSETYPGKNPHLNNKESIRGGMSLYRRMCGDCHALDATGYRGPDLTALLAAGTPDERLFQVIRKGVPGSEMPASNRPDHELLQIIAYLRNIGGAPAADTAPAGNVANGQTLFSKQCVTCHQVAGKGGRLGPDLSRIGSARSRAALVREIRTPHEWIAPGYETVTLVTKDGQKIRGVEKNEDAFSIQIMDMRERIQGYRKSDVQVMPDQNSLMPVFDAKRLSDSDLSDLVGYLSTLRGHDVAVR
jgi:putative heme-binding domain-containing protein